MTGVVVGIDPGINGGIALIYLESGTVQAIPMPVIKVGAKTEIDIKAVAWFVRQSGLIRLAAVERVSARPGQGVCSMFSFGVGYGAVRAVLETLEVPYEMPTPQRWQSLVLGSVPKGDSKLYSVAYCTKRFPTLSLAATPRSRKAHDGIADAVCLAEYARRLAFGKGE